MNTIDRLYRTTVIDKRAKWEDFRKNHEKLFGLVYATCYRPYKVYRHHQYKDAYKKFKDFTMLQEYGYTGNLALCDQFRHINGSVVECGTWKGGMIAGIASIFNDDRHYCLYDSFEGLPPAVDIDIDRYGRPAKELQKTRINWLAISESTARQAMELSGANNVHIHKGWFNETLPDYNYGPIAILRADGDFYESTMDIFTNLHKHVVKDGLIIIDDYYYWDGCAKAVHDFLSNNQLSDKIRQCPTSYAYIIKS